MVTKKIFLKNTDEVVCLLGQHDENLKRLEKAYNVQIFVRQGSHRGDFSLVIRGPGGKVEKTLAELEQLRTKIYRPVTTENKKREVSTHDYNHGINSDVIYVTHRGKKIKPRSVRQERYVRDISEYDIVMSIGPAGTGKTFLAVACALKALQANRVERIVLSRPVVEAGEKLGFLPGDLFEKINPYLKPLYDAFYVMLGPEKFRFLRDEEVIEIVPLAYMRGRTIDNAFIILDEAQNTSPEQIKMLLTRMGTGSKIAVTGDVTQIDLEDKKRSGLVIAEKILSPVQGIKIIHFGEEDVVRHELVKRVIKAYEKWERA